MRISFTVLVITLLTACAAGNPRHSSADMAVDFGVIGGRPGQQNVNITSNFVLGPDGLPPAIGARIRRFPSTAYTLAFIVRKLDTATNSYTVVERSPVREIPADAASGAGAFIEANFSESAQTGLYKFDIVVDGVQTQSVAFSIGPHPTQAAANSESSRLLRSLHCQFGQAGYDYYSAVAQHLGATGRVVVTTTIDKAGHAQNAAVTESSSMYLNAGAMQLVKSMRCSVPSDWDAQQGPERLFHVAVAFQIIAGFLQIPPKPAPDSSADETLTVTVSH